MKLRRQNSNNPKDNIRNTAKVLLILALFSIGFAHLIVHECRASGEESENSRFSLNVEEEALRAVLQKISTSTGYTITISEELADMPVTVRIKDVSLDKGLRRLLKGFNYTLVTLEEEKKIIITVYDRGKNSGKTPITASSEVIRPAHSRERGVPQEPIEKKRMRQRRVAPEKKKVISPVDPQEPEAVVKKMETLIKEMEALREQNKNGGSGDLLPIPPEEMLKKMNPQPESDRE